MKSLTSPIVTEAAGEQSAWAELYDFYLKASIATPYGTTNVIRITDCPGNQSFFTPVFDPEPLPTQGLLGTYYTWPVKRETIKTTSKTANDKLAIAVSNVTGEWAMMLGAVDWYDVAVVIRKVSLSIASPTNADYCVLFNGRIDTARVTWDQLQFTCSNDLGTFETILPRESQHTNCRFGWGDDYCTALKHLSENCKPKTVGASSTVRNLFSSYIGYSGQSVSPDPTTDKIILAGHTLSDGNRVRFGGGTVPAPLTRGQWYWVVSKSANDFKVSATYGGAVIDLTTTGSAVVMDSESGLLEDGTSPLPIDPGTGFCLDFDGTTSFGSIADSSSIDFNYNQDFTVEFWARANSSQPVASYGCSMVSKNDVGTGFSYSVVLVRPSGLIVADRYDGFHNPNVTSTTRIDDNKWHHVAFVRTTGSPNSTIALYVDGVVQASAIDTTNTTTTNAGFVCLGKRIADNLEYFKGSLQEIRIWNYARTAMQIQSAMYRRVNAGESGLACYIAMTEGSGSVAADATGNANHATLSNTPWLSSYGTDLARLLASSAITTSSEQTGNQGYRVRAKYENQPVTADITTEKIILNGHILENGDLIVLAGTLPAGIVAGTSYFVVNKGTNDFQLAATAGGSAINLTGSNGSGITLSSADAPWKFGVMGANPNPDVDIYSPFIQFDFGSAKSIRQWVVKAGQAGDKDLFKERTFDVFYCANPATNPWLSAGSYLISADRRQAVPVYTLQQASVGAFQYWRMVIKMRDGSPFLNDVCSTILAYANNSAADLVDPHNNHDGSSATISTSLEISGNEGSKVKSGYGGSWRVNNSWTAENFNTSDWGVNEQGYWRIPDSQAGLQNAALRPYIQFDFGSAAAVQLWRLQTLPNVERNQIPRLITFFSSSSATFATDVTFELFYELPPQPGSWFDVLIPKAQTKRYWRLCVRSTWAESLSYTMFNKINAYANARHWWNSGRILFAADTATVALRNVSRQVIGSYNGRIDCVDLPVAPAVGDVFVIQRGCPRTFNACGARQNQEHFGGDTTLPFETVVR